MKPILLFVVNVDWFFLSHRLPIAKAALQEGYDVHVATGLTLPRDRIEQHGLVVHGLDLHRSSFGLIGAARLFWQLLVLFWQLKPDIVHLVTIKPVLIGGIAARLQRARGVLFAISGLGYIFLAEGIVARLRRFLVSLLYRYVLTKRNAIIVFQNKDDLADLSRFAHLPAERVEVVRGSGIDLGVFKQEPPPEGVPVVLMPSRLLADKGVREFASAARMLRDKVSARFVFAGDVDPENPASLEPAEVRAWVDEGIVEWWGHCSDMPATFASCHVVVLPSYREGLPKALIEAAACGRPVVTTDVPGCRDAIVPDETGFLVPPKNAHELADAIRRFVEDPELRERAGEAGRKLAESVFNIEQVVSRHLEFYRRLVPSQQSDCLR